MKKRFLASRNVLFAAKLPRALVALAAFSALVLAFRVLAPDTLLALTAPLFNLGTTFAEETHRALDALSANRTLVLERDALARENGALTLENATLTAKVEDLEKLLGAARPVSAIATVAGVLVRPPESPYDTLIIGAGSRAGITEGARVYGPSGTPLGSIESVSETAARAVLFSAPGATLDAWIGKARTPSKLHGAGAGAYTARVPRGAAIALGESVYAAGPGAAAIGSVVRITGEPSSPLATILIRSAVNLFSLTSVLIVRSESGPWPAFSVGTTSSP